MVTVSLSAREAGDPSGPVGGEPPTLVAGQPLGLFGLHGASPVSPVGEPLLRPGASQEGASPVSEAVPAHRGDDRDGWVDFPPAEDSAGSGSGLGAGPGVRAPGREGAAEIREGDTTVPSGRIDKSVLSIATPKRDRDKAHLGFVARRRCLVCGRKPCDPHHLRFAQPRALGRKVSDEYTVPLCRTHHRALHRSGDERTWWAAVAIEPIAIAQALWSSSRRARHARHRAGVSTAAEAADGGRHVPEALRSGRASRLGGDRCGPDRSGPDSASAARRPTQVSRRRPAAFPIWSEAGAAAATRSPSSTLRSVSC
ncbi:hypothetical protein [Rhodoplanes roseus]|uniref:DUF968 domain-containing protein n=1 Tax=Rhodoplanes roseus TaxID=29409 RepID=UPI001FDF1754|nr:hypothetical protein [Rhodoplanes roseus]